MELILASASPRRKELLEKIGLPFTVQPAMGEERITQKSPAAVVMELSRQKAEEIAAAQTEDCIIIGADTVVARGEKINDFLDSFWNLNMLQPGRTSVAGTHS